MDLVKELKSKDLKDFIEDITYQEANHVGTDTYRFKKCPICGNGDHFTINTRENLYNSFGHSCGAGSIIDFYMNYFGEDMKTSIQKLSKSFNIKYKEDNNVDIVDFNKYYGQSYEQKQEIKSISKKPTKTDLGIDLTSIINSYYTLDKNNLKYFIERGIFEDAVTNKYKLCGGNVKEIFKDNLNVLPNISGYDNVIPVWEGKEVVNCILKGKGLNALNLKGLPLKLFNTDYLNGPEKLIFITEGIFDCLSIECLGYKSICLNSVNMASKLIETIKEMGKKQVFSSIQDCYCDWFYKTRFILALDNDEAGQKATKKLTEELTNLRIEFSSLNIPKEIGKDINDWYLSNKEQLKERINRIIDYDCDFEYLDEFQKNVIENKYRPIISTGFTKLDDKLNGGLYPGLYTIGAISSLGKTAFAIQIADQIAKSGQKVLFFSLEMPKDELMSRCISRTMFLKNPKTCMDIGTMRVLYGKTDYCKDEYKTAIEEYRERLENFKIIQCDFGTDIKFIVNYVERFIEKTGITPVVFVDYLQIIKASKTEKYVTEKEKTDMIVVELKRLSNKKLPVIVISSFNRENYDAPVSYNSFKESGGIEYTSDFVIGLQLSVLDDLKKAEKTEKARMLHDAKSRNPREVTCIILKNRNGESNTRQKYKFYCKNNLFEEIGGI